MTATLFAGSPTVPVVRDATVQVTPRAVVVLAGGAIGATPAPEVDGRGGSLLLSPSTVEGVGAPVGGHDATCTAPSTLPATNVQEWDQVHSLPWSDASPRPATPLALPPVERRRLPGCRTLAETVEAIVGRQG